MAITSIFGVDNVAPRTDNEIPYIEGVPWRFEGGNNNLQVVNETATILRKVRGGETRRVLRLTNTGSSTSGFLIASAKDLMGEHVATATRWTIGYRLRYEANIDSRPLGNGAGLSIVAPSSVTRYTNAFTSDEVAPYMTSDRYTYFEVCFDWENAKILRWVDGYRLPDRTLGSNAINNRENIRFALGTYHGGGNTTYCRLTDIYALCDTSHIGDDTSPSERLGGAYVRSLAVSDVTMGEGWKVSNQDITPETILNGPISTTIGSRLSPYLISSVSENPTWCRFEKPTPGQIQRLGRGNILFVQASLNTHRFNGSTASLNVNVIQDDVESTTPEKSLDLFVDGYEGRDVARLNTPLDGSSWTPDLVHAHQVRVYTESGGGGD